MELVAMISFFGISFLFYAFSEDKDILFIWSILWKFMIVKIGVLFFYYKRKKWTILFNLIQNIAIFFVLIYAFFYTLIYGNHGQIASLIGFVIIILAIIYLYYSIIKMCYQDWKFQLHS